jgi:hypothetical protein
MQSDQYIKVPRSIDTYAQETIGDVFSFRYSYVRSQESVRENESGQDYLTYSDQGDSFLFALCDGVSQSFFGELAAQLLGNDLLTWLRELGGSVTEEDLHVSLTDRLSDLTGQASQIIQNHPIGMNTPAMIAEVLEEKRSMGSESMFLCGRIDWPREEIPEGRMLLSWMGDGRIRIWKKERELTSDLGEILNTNQRWSSRGGVVGDPPKIFLSPIRDNTQIPIYTRIQVYTDGFELMDGIDSRMNDEKLIDLIQEIQQLPESDDLSMIDIWWDE